MQYKIQPLFYQQMQLHQGFRLKKTALIDSQGTTLKQTQQNRVQYSHNLNKNQIKKNKFHNKQNIQYKQNQIINSQSSLIIEKQRHQIAELMKVTKDMKTNHFKEKQIWNKEKITFQNDLRDLLITNRQMEIKVNELQDKIQQINVNYFVTVDQSQDNINKIYYNRETNTEPNKIINMQMQTQTIQKIESSIIRQKQQCVDVSGNQQSIIKHENQQCAMEDNNQQSIIERLTKKLPKLHQQLSFFICFSASLQKQLKQKDNLLNQKQTQFKDLIHQLEELKQCIAEQNNQSSNFINNYQNSDRYNHQTSDQQEINRLKVQLATYKKQYEDLKRKFLTIEAQARTNSGQSNCYQSSYQMSRKYNALQKQYNILHSSYKQLYIQYFQISAYNSQIDLTAQSNKIILSDLIKTTKLTHINLHPKQN